MTFYLEQFAALSGSGLEDDTSPSSDVICAAWSSTLVDGVYLAVSRRNGEVHLFSEEGERIITEVKIQHGLPNRVASVLAWHPKESKVACGWDDGKITIWSERERSLSVDSTGHMSGLTLAMWSPDGSRLLTGDKNGVLSVWQCDHRNRLILVSHYSKPGLGALTHCVFRSSPTSDAIKDNPPPRLGMSRCPSFFFGGTQGMICLGDDMGHCTEIINLRNPIKIMDHSLGLLPPKPVSANPKSSNPSPPAPEEIDYLTIVTQDVVLYKLSISAADGKKSQDRKVKLSVRGDGSDLQCVWAGKGLLAAANNEPLIRVWHIDQDASYILQPPLDRTGSMPRGGNAPTAAATNKDLIRCVAYNAQKRVLAAGTSTGRVLLWRFTAAGPSDKAGASARTPSEADWETLPASNLRLEAEPVQSLSWGLCGSGDSSGGGSGVLAICSNKKVSIVSDSVMRCRSAGATSVMQTGGDTLSLQTGDSKPRELKCGLRIKGLDLTSRHLLVWSGKRAEVYEFEPTAPAPAPAPGVRPLSQFACKAQTLALHTDSLFVLLGGRVEIWAFDGSNQKTISFSEVEGHPVCLHVQGDFLAVATDMNVLKLWDLSRKELKPVIPGRPLNKVGPIKSVRINCNGSKVALLTNKADDSHTQQTDSRVFVFDVETDKVVSFDCDKTGKVPSSIYWDSAEPMLLGVEAVAPSVPLSLSQSAAPADSKEAKSRPTSAAPAAETLPASTSGLFDKDVAIEGPISALIARNNLKAGLAAASGAGSAASPSGSTGPAASSAPTAGGNEDAEVFTLFASPENGILLQDSFPVRSSLERLMAVEVPYCVFMSRAPVTANSSAGSSAVVAVTVSTGDGPRVRRHTMRDFVGMEKVSDETKKDLIQFSFQLTIGNMDEAYKAVKRIQNPAVWENMLTMCVKNRRLDVAAVCLGNTNNARGAKALREAKSEPQPEAQLAAVAIELGLLDDAEKLYRDCSRYDLLAQLYQSVGLWDAALQLSKRFDQIHLKPLQYQYARHLESGGDFARAVKMYEESATHTREVPRMLFDNQRIPDLETYIAQKEKDVDLIKWWAQYLESTGNYQESVRFYDAAKDWLSVCRVLCFLGEFDKAADVCINSDDTAACFHLARQFEGHNNVKAAIQFYGRAKRFAHGIRLARENQLDTELLMLALEGGAGAKGPGKRATTGPVQEMQIAAAKYFEEKDQFEKAVLLYQKAGSLMQALQLCERAQLFDSLRNIAEDLMAQSSGAPGGAETGSGSAPSAPLSMQDAALLQRCAHFFLSHEQFEKAVHLFVACKQHAKALDICVQAGLKVSEDLAEKLSPPKSEVPEEAAERNRILATIAQCALDQGDYALATRKFTQAGDKIRAMRSLIKSENTEKIIYYAAMTKTRELFILAANYLQTLDWHGSPELMKTIITFYTKARAMEQLSGFYDACAQVEIDDYRNYEKALAALNEAMKCLIKANTHSGAGQDREQRLQAFNRRIKLVEKFVEARRLAKSDPQQTIVMCEQLLASPDIETAIRSGDVYALLIEYFYSLPDKAGLQDAFQLLSRMRNSGILLSPYVDPQMIEVICAAVGVSFEPEAVGAPAPVGEDLSYHGRNRGYSGQNDGDEPPVELEEDIATE